MSTLTDRPLPLLACLCLLLTAGCASAPVEPTPMPMEGPPVEASTAELPVTSPEPTSRQTTTVPAVPAKDQEVTQEAPASESVAAPAPAPARASQPTAGEGTTGGTSAQERGVVTLDVTSQASSRKGAIVEGLREAVERVHGTALQSDLVLASQFVVAEAFLRGEEFTASGSIEVIEESIATSTSGLIESYSVVGEREVPGGVEVDLAVRIPSYDPAFRPGGVQTVLVLPFETVSQTFQVDGQALAAQPFAEEFEAALIDALVASPDFLVIDRNHSAEIRSMLDGLKQDIANGATQVIEGGKLGQLKSVDLLVTGRLETISQAGGARKLSTGNTFTWSRVEVASSLKVTSVAEGVLLGNDRFSQGWGGESVQGKQELTALGRRWRGAPPLAAGMAEAVQSHLAELEQVADRLRQSHAPEAVSEPAARPATHLREGAVPGGEEPDVTEDELASKAKQVSWGVEAVELASGPALISMGMATYNTKMPRGLRLRGRQAAVLRASVEAQKQLVEFFEGSEIQADQKLLSSIATTVTNDATSTESALSTEEGIRSLAQGVLRGAVVVAMEDDREAGEVQVWLASSPQSRRSITRSSTRGAEYPSWESALAHVEHSLEAGLLPPVGGMIVQVPSTGDTAWIAFGSSVPVSQNAKHLKPARQAAKLRAQESLVALINGKPMTSAEELLETYEKAESEVNDYLSGDYSSEAEAVSKSTVSSQVQSFIQGDLGAARYDTLRDPEGEVEYCVAYIRERGVPTTESNKIPTPAAGGRAPQAQPQARAASIAAPIPAPVARVQQDPCSETSRPGLRAVKVTSLGVTRKDAIAGGLVQALEQVNGVSLKSDLLLTSRLETMESYIGGAEFAEATSTEVVEQTISTKTSGMVDSFSVLGEKEVGGGVEVDLCVRVPVYDPAWRPGGKQTVVVLPFDAGPAAFNLEGEAYPSITFAEEAEFALLDALVASDKFYVIDRRNSEAVRDALASIKSDVATGAMKTIEMGKVGNLKGVDLLISGRIDHLSSSGGSRKLSTGNTFVWNRVEVDSMVQVTSVAEGTVLGSDRFSAGWGGESLQAMKEYHLLLSNWGGSSPATAAFAAAMQSHIAKVETVADKLRNAKRLEVLEFIEDAGIVLLKGPAELMDELRVGQALCIKWVRAIQGSEFLLDRCRVTIQSIQRTGEVIAVFTPGDGQTRPLAGDLAETCP